MSKHNVRQILLSQANEIIATVTNMFHLLTQIKVLNGTTIIIDKSTTQRIYHLITYDTVTPRHTCVVVE